MKFPSCLIKKWRSCRVRHFVSVQGPNQVTYGPFNKFGPRLIFGSCDLIDLLQNLIFQSDRNLRFFWNRVFGTNHFTLPSSTTSFFRFSSHKSPIFGGFIPQIHFKTFNLNCNLLIYDSKNSKIGKFSPKSQILSQERFSPKSQILSEKSAEKVCIQNMCNQSLGTSQDRYCKSLRPLTVLDSEVQEVRTLSRGRMIVHGITWHR